MNSNTSRQTTNSLGHREWAMSLLRRLIAHTVTYENHIRPHLERLHSHCSEMSPTSFRKEFDIVVFYARHAGALQSVLEVHLHAAEKFRVNLLGFMNLIRPGPSEPAPGHWQPLRTSQLQIMSSTLDLNDLDVNPNSAYLRGDLERATLSHILAVLTIVTGIIRGHKKDTKLPDSTVNLPSPHDLFLFFKNSGGTIVKNLAGSLSCFSRSVRVNVVRRCRSILLDELKVENVNVSFAVDEVNKVAGQHMNSIWKSSDKNIPTGSAMTAVSHALQHIGTTVYAGTGLRYGLIEEAVSAVGKDIVIMAPSLPATSFRTVVFVLNRLLNFRNLSSNPLPAQCIEIPMLIGRMRFLEMFMRDLIDRSDLKDVPLSNHPHPTSVFCKALIKIGIDMESKMGINMIPALSVNNALKPAFELTTSGVMRLPGSPGDPENADSILVRCGMVHISDSSVHQSNQESVDPTTSSFIFLNQEPMIQYALSRVILRDDSKFLSDLKEYIWHALIVPENDGHLNSIKILGWLLLRAMSQDCALQRLVVGNDQDLNKYVNETSFVWRDPTTQKENQVSEEWLLKLENEARQKFDKGLQQVFGTKEDGSPMQHYPVQEIWYHVAILSHSDAQSARFLPRVTVLAPQEIGTDVIGSWRHATNKHEKPLLMLMACSREFADEKLKKDAFYTDPSNLGY